MSQEIIKNANQPAFSFREEFGFDGNQYAGLTKREYFAAMAMQGLIAAEVDEISSPEGIAWLAVERADALLAELEAEQAPSAEASDRDFEVRQLAYEQGLNPDDSYG